ncbi:conserved phage C-terminal domain-containing protein [Xenorhabdus bovienii]|uniref:conserved phage C-terminal domain-containing protein n=1 Tax=Xenorhabdus bovienii TaxID=40576 RepID=UPI0023B2E090|nr:conserved phage C-terminal domain-containing protein [Xenorhabdus bovienii]MDE9466410.1 conserved phage C-terminal domain-containing protein [Xenorhabdus bovienii]MDE9487788.1 conserved phage C-terminal domain-containing protein [Xenorhabdus bovienii]
MSLLLLRNRPLVVIPELAVRLGLNEAIVLQQIQYWLIETASGIEKNGHRWIYNTIEKWQEQFPFFSESTIKRAFANLKKIGVLRIEQINKSNHDRTNYYSINYEHASLTDEVKMTPSNNSKPNNRKGQNDPIDKRKLKQSNGSECATLNGSNWPDLTENTTESTTESTTENYCQVPEEPNDPAHQVLNYFNQATDSNYRDGKTSMGYIRARLSEGYATEDLILITDYLIAKWANDGKMRDYLRPKTLFSPENCAEYFDKACKWHKAERPACVNGRWLKAGEADVVIDTVERDATFRQLFSTGWTPANRIQERAAQLARKAGVGRMNEVPGLAAWRGIWKQAAEQIAKDELLSGFRVVGGSPEQNGGIA